MSKDDWKRRYRAHLAGLALIGSASEVRDSPLSRGARALEIPAEVERLLDRMYEDLFPATPATNGTIVVTRPPVVPVKTVAPANGQGRKP